MITILTGKIPDRSGGGKYTKDYEDITAYFCKRCKPEAKRLRGRYNQRISRMKKMVRFVRDHGGRGRIKQKLDFNNEAHIKIKKLKNRIWYWKTINTKKREKIKIVIKQLKEQVRYYKKKANE